MQKQQEVYGNIAKIYQPEILIIQLKDLQQLIILIHLSLKQKSQVEQEMVEQKMLK